MKSSILYRVENARLTAWHDGVGDRNGTSTVEASLEPAVAMSVGDWNCQVPADVRMNGIYSDLDEQYEISLFFYSICSHQVYKHNTKLGLHTKINKIKYED